MKQLDLFTVLQMWSHHKFVWWNDDIDSFAFKPFPNDPQHGIGILHSCPTLASPSFSCLPLTKAHTDSQNVTRHTLIYIYTNHTLSATHSLLFITFHSLTTANTCKCTTYSITPTPPTLKSPTALASHSFYWRKTSLENTKEKMKPFADRIVLSGFEELASSPHGSG